MSAAAHYDWIDSNRESRFPGWEDEIAHMEALGLKLVRPDFKVPGWAARLQSPETRPKLYVCSPDGPREMDANLDRYAAELGYPLYFKPA